MRIAVIGGGIAGASSAYALARHRSRPEVVLLEAEQQLAYHSTGRSAAQLIENYGAPTVRPLTSASLAFLRNPPADLCDQPILYERGQLTLGQLGQEEQLSAAADEGSAVNPAIELLTPNETVELFPAVRPEKIIGAVYDPDSADIDVALLHQVFIRGFRACGGTIRTMSRVDPATLNSDGTWKLETTSGPERADLVVNAAGAWADRVAERAGVKPVGLQPLRRTAFMVRSNVASSASWPLVADLVHSWYVKPDGVQFLCSPANEDLSEPVDAKPAEIEIAGAIERINEMTTLAIRSVASSWAGLRTFAPDRSMVLGADPAVSSFIWCAGQGGTGIQTSVSAGQLICDLTIEGFPGPTFDDSLDLAGLSPERFGQVAN